MALTFGTLVGYLELDSSKFDRGIDTATGRAEGKVGGLGGVAKKAAAVMGGAFAATKVVDFLHGSVDAASDLNETVSKSRTIFGPAGAALEKWASGAAKAIGQSKQQALDAAATFGNLFVQLGTGTQSASKMSRQMVELASDFASFHNAAPVDVIDAMTAAFRGEFDAVQRFVPTINAATVAQQALAMTGKTTTDALTEQEKALATQALLLQGAGDAAGDFARTSDSLANKQRIVSAQMADLKTTIGNALLPVMEKLTGAVIGLVDWWNALSPAGKELVAVIGAMTAAVGAVIAAVKVWTTVQAILNATLLANPVGLVIAAVAALAAGLVVAYQRSDTFRSIVKGAFDAVTKAIDAVMAAVGPLLGFFRDNWGLILAPLTGGLSLLVQHFDKVRDIIRAVIDWLKKIPDAVDKALGPLDEVIGKAGGIIGKGAGAIGGAVGKVGDIFRADGGPVSARHPYIVGERGPELFVPGASGTIVPSAQLPVALRQGGMSPGGTYISSAGNQPYEIRETDRSIHFHGDFVFPTDDSAERTAASVHRELSILQWTLGGW